MVTCRALLKACLVGTLACISGCGSNENTQGTTGSSASPDFNVPPGSYELHSASVAACIDVNTSQTADGTKVQLWECNGTLAQRFRFERSGEGTYRLLSVISGKCLETNEVGTILRTCNDSATQLFRFQGSATHLTVVHAATGQCADMESTDAPNGTNVVLRSCSQMNGQIWKLLPTLSGTGALLERACTPDDVTFEDLDPAGGGATFLSLFPDPAALIEKVSREVCTSLYRDAAEAPRRSSIALTIRRFPPEETAPAFSPLGRLIVDSKFIQDVTSRLSSDAARLDITGLFLHELTHNYQRFGELPVGLREGIADFVKYRAGFIPESERKLGGNWTDGYVTTAFFLSYLDARYPDFVYRLNLAAFGYSDETFVALTGKPVDALWLDYQAWVQRNITAGGG